MPQFFASASSLRKRWLFVLLTLAYKRSDQGRAYFRDQAANTHNGYCTTTILVFPEDQVTAGSSSLGSLSNIKTPYWGTPEIDIVIIYDIGSAPGILWRLDVPYFAEKNGPGRFESPSKTAWSPSL